MGSKRIIRIGTKCTQTIRDKIKYKITHINNNNNVNMGRKPGWNLWHGHCEKTWEHEDNFWDIDGVVLTHNRT